MAAKPAAKATAFPVKPLVFQFINTKGGLGKTTACANLADVVKTEYPQVSMRIFDPVFEKAGSLSTFYREGITPVNTNAALGLVPMLTGAIDEGVQVTLSDSLGPKQDEFVNEWLIGKRVPATLHKKGVRLVLVLVNDFSNQALKDIHMVCRAFKGSSSIEHAHILTVMNVKEHHGMLTEADKANYRKRHAEIVNTLKDNMGIPESHYHNAESFVLPTEIKELCAKADAETGEAMSFLSCVKKKIFAQTATMYQEVAETEAEDITASFKAAFEAIATAEDAA